MPSRPLGIYVIAVWLFALFIIEFHYPFPLLAYIRQLGGVFTLSGTLLGWMTIALIVALIQLRNTGRQIAVVAFCISAFYSLVRIILAIFVAKNNSNFETMAILVISIAISSLSIWYLTRPHFIQNASDYRKFVGKK